MIGTPFPISTVLNVDEDASSVASDDINFLVVWAAGPNVGPTREVKGQLVSPTTGLVGPQVTISSGYGAYPSVAFGGGQYLVVWTENSRDTDVRARFVNPNGALGLEFSVNASPTLKVGGFGIPVVSYDGTDFLVAWAREKNAASNQDLDVYAQRVSPAGTLLGGVIPVCTSGNAQWGLSVDFDGANYLIAWTETLNDIDQDMQCDANESTCWDINGQFVSPASTLVGPVFSIVSDAGTQHLSPLCWSSPDSRYMVVWTDGDSP